MQVSYRYCSNIASADYILTFYLIACPVDKGWECAKMGYPSASKTLHFVINYVFFFFNSGKPLRITVSLGFLSIGNIHAENMVRRLLTSLYIRRSFIYTFQLAKIKISVNKTVCWYHLYIGFKLKERKISVMVSLQLCVWMCRSIFYFVLSYLSFFLVSSIYLFIYFYWRSRGQITTSRGSDNLVSC